MPLERAVNGVLAVQRNLAQVVVYIKASIQTSGIFRDSCPFKLRDSVQPGTLPLHKFIIDHDKKPSSDGLIRKKLVGTALTPSRVPLESPYRYLFDEIPERGPGKHHFLSWLY